MKKEIFEVKVKKVFDEFSDNINDLKTSVRDYSKDDFKRYGASKIRKWVKDDRKTLQQYQSGKIWDIGILAKARVGVKFEEKNYSYWLAQTLQSGGLWGIVTDGSEYDNDEHDRIALEQMDELKKVLLAFGFNQEEIEEKFENWEWDEEC